MPKKSDAKKIKKFPRPTAFSFRWAFLAVGLILARVDVYCLTCYPPHWVLGFLTQLAAAFCLIQAFPAVTPMPEMARPSVSKSAPKNQPPSSPAAIAFFAVAALMISCLWAFRTVHLGLGSFLGLVAVGTAGWLLFRKKLWDNPSVFKVDEGKWLWGILLFAALFRFAFVSTNVIGLQGDEANNLTDTLGISDGLFVKGPFVTGWGGTPTFPDYIVAGFFKILGAKLWVARTVSSLASLVTLWFFYHWCRFWMGAVASLAATFLMSVSWWFFFFSLSPFHNSILFLAQTGAFYFLEKGFREGKRMDFWWVGFLGAMCVMNYVPGRSVPVSLFIAVAATIVLRGWKFLKAVWKPLILSALAFCWLLAPFVMYVLEIPTEFWGRVDPHWITQEYQHSGSYLFLAKAYLWTLVSLWMPNPSVDFRFAPAGLPFTDPFTGAFVLLGLGLSIFRPQKPSTWVLAPGIFAGLSANALARLGWPTDLAYLHSIRFSIVLPFLFLACGWGLEWFFKLYENYHPRGLGWIKGAMVAVAIGAITLNVPILISKFGGDKGGWGDHGFSQIDLAQIILDNAATHHFLVDSDAISNATVFLVHGKADPKWLFLDQDIPIHYQVTKNVMLIFPPWRATDAQKQKIRDVYPRAVWADHKTPWGDVYLNSVDIPLEDILASQKGMALKEALP